MFSTHMNEYTEQKKGRLQISETWLWTCLDIVLTFIEKSKILNAERVASIMYDIKLQDCYITSEE